MSQRDAIKVAAACVILLVGVGLIVISGRAGNRRGAPAPTSLYYFDLQAGELFIDEPDRIPPFTAPSGGEAVRAFVYTCGECEASQLIVGHLRKLDEKAIEVTGRLATVDETQRQTLYMAIQAGTFVAAVPEPGQSAQWVAIADPAGYALTQRFRDMCGGTLAKICTPQQVR